MDQNICPICIEPITEEYNPYNCIHHYHKECIILLETSSLKSKFFCSLCNSKKKINFSDGDYSNYKFNNMLEDEKIFNIQDFINKWNYKQCIKDNHKLYLETLGDWYFSTVDRNMKMSYKVMHIECKICKKEQLIK